MAVGRKVGARCSRSGRDSLRVSGAPPEAGFVTGGSE